MYAFKGARWKPLRQGPDHEPHRNWFCWSCSSSTVDKNIIGTLLIRYVHRKLHYTTNVCVSAITLARKTLLSYLSKPLCDFPRNVITTMIYCDSNISQFYKYRRPIYIGTFSSAWLAFLSPRTQRYNTYTIFLNTSVYDTIIININLTGSPSPYRGSPSPYTPDRMVWRGGGVNRSSVCR